LGLKNSEEKVKKSIGREKVKEKRKRRGKKKMVNAKKRK
jgi:hypothetical protein